jgi:topoisomerase-4 subunit A
MNEAAPPPDSSPGAPDAEAIPLARALEERYLAYALSTITQRALPDVRDGLKPVHRRLLYAMRQLRLDPDQGFKKCARVVGDVIGKYHPHGDQSVYDALVRLAQGFAQRYPLADGQGNFGNIDGDNAAAMRYTEARLTEVAQTLLDGIDEDAVDFRDTYDGEESEPVVLPANFPNLLANGASGIAVGMATSIPPHNAGELCAAALRLIENPKASVEELVELVPGPDFPTGGILVEPGDQIVEAYRTGRGGFRLRARWEREETGRGGYLIVVTEIPYGVQKSRLVEKLAELIHDRKAPLLADVRDESAEDIRLVLEPRSRNVDADMLMEQLFRLSDLETRVPLNMNVLQKGRVPGVLGLGEVLAQWLAHRREVLQRRARFRLEKIAARLEVLSGYLVAYLNLDEVIGIIREEDDPKARLMARFELTDNQAEAILNMRLRSLRKLDEIEIRREHGSLGEERNGLERLLGSDRRQWTAIGKQIAAIRDRFGQGTDLGRRRTTLGRAPAIEEGLAEAMVEREPVTVVLSERGWARALKGHVDDLTALAFKEGDRLKFWVHAQTTDRLLLLATGGRFFTLAADRLPGGRGAGEPLRLMIDLGEDEAIAALMVHRPGGKLIVAASTGHGFVVPEDAVVAMTRKGRQVLNVAAPAEAVLAAPAGGDHVAVLGDNRKLLIFPLAELNEMTRGRGVRLQRYARGGLADAKAFSARDGLTWIDASGRTFTVSDFREWLGARAQAGRMVPKGFPRSNRFGAGR